MDDSVFLKIERRTLRVEVTRVTRPWWLLGQEWRRSVTRVLEVTSRSLQELIELEALTSAADAALKLAGLPGLSSVGHAELILMNPRAIRDASRVLTSTAKVRGRELPMDAVKWVLDTHYEINYPPKPKAAPATAATPSATDPSSGSSSAGPSTSAASTSSA